jgi:hypothetical protein
MTRSGTAAISTTGVVFALRTCAAVTVTLPVFRTV